MKVLLRLLVLGMVGLIAVNQAAALSQNDSGSVLSDWSVEEQCIDVPAAQSDWTFDGTILMRGNYGIHAYQSGWETPRVAVFLHEEHALRGGALSPDGNWYVYPWGDFFVTETYNAVTSVEELHVHSTRDETEYRVPLHIEGYGGTYVQAYWIDNETILFENWLEPNGVVRVSPFSGGVSTWETFPDAPNYYSPFLHVSGDWTAFVSPYTSARSAWGLFVFEDEVYVYVTDLPFGEPYRPVEMAWSPNGMQFVAQVEDAIALFDRAGMITDTILTLDPTTYPYLAPNSFQWSSSDRYLTFVLTQEERWQHGYSTTYPTYGGLDYGPNRLYIADLQDQTVIDTCLEVGWGLAWSPVVDQLALVGSGEGQVPLRILDVSSRQLHTVAYHGVSYTRVMNDTRVILGWRVD